MYEFCNMHQILTSKITNTATVWNVLYPTLKIVFWGWEKLIFLTRKYKRKYVRQFPGLSTDLLHHFRIELSRIFIFVLQITAYCPHCLSGNASGTPNAVDKAHQQEQPWARSRHVTNTSCYPKEHLNAILLFFLQFSKFPLENFCTLSHPFYSSLK